MAVRSEPHDLMRMLPPVRGDLRPGVPLARYTWFRVGGPAEVLFEPADPADLAEFIAARPVDVPVTVIGGTSNLLVRDGGVEGVVVRLGRAFSDISVVGERVIAGAAAADINVARRAHEAGIGGLEFMFGIPGTVGGGIRMNAGAYGREFKDVCESVSAIDALGQMVTLSNADLGFGYRHTQVSASHIFIAATFLGEQDDPDAIERRMVEIQHKREASQPVRARTGGSTFANPPGHKAWELIDAAGCRGLRRGGAMVSAEHCNFLINTGGATARDIEGLGEEVRARVEKRFGIQLDWEIRCIGQPGRPDIKEAS